MSPSTNDIHTCHKPCPYIVCKDSLSVPTLYSPRCLPHSGRVQRAALMTSTARTSCSPLPALMINTISPPQHRLCSLTHPHYHRLARNPPPWSFRTIKSSPVDVASPAQPSHTSIRSQHCKVLPSYCPSKVTEADFSARLLLRFWRGAFCRVWFLK